MNSLSIAASTLSLISRHGVGSICTWLAFGRHAALRASRLVYPLPQFTVPPAAAC
jgi:hypothetical protein